MVTRYHIEAWKKLPQVEIAAICAWHLENARKRAAEFKPPVTYDDVTVMLDKEKPDVLDIAAPPEVHAELAIPAANRNIHILYQKPMTPGPKTIQQLVDAISD